MLRVSVGQQRSFLDAATLAPDDKRYEFGRFYAREILPLVTDRDFEELYSEVGRGAVSPALVFHALILAKIEGLSDRQAAQAVAVRLDWKVALNLRVDYRGFDATRFVRFRSRFLERDSTNDHQSATAAEKARIRILFDRIIEKLIEYGLIKKDQATRLDSTHILSAAKNINRYQTVFESMKLAVRALDGIDPAVLNTPELSPLREKYTKPMGAYDLKQERVRKNLEIVVKDAICMLNTLGTGPYKRHRAVDAITVLERAVKDNVELKKVGNEPEGKAGEQRSQQTPPLSDEEIARIGTVGGLKADDVAVVERQSGDRMITPHDRTARLGVKKGGKLRWVGQKLHATETVPTEQLPFSFVVDGEVTPANQPDIAQTIPDLERLDVHGLNPDRLYVDKGYVSGETVAMAQSEYGTELYGPPAVPRETGRFPVEKFSVDFEAGRATCPAQKTSNAFKVELDDDGRLLGATARFGKVACAGCPLTAQCLGAGQSARTVSFTAHHATLVAQREKAQTPEFKAEYKNRSPGEGIFSELAGALDLRRSKVTGVLKSAFEQMQGLASINVKRLFRVFERHPEAIPVRC